MEQVYFLGVACIKVIQYWLADYQYYFQIVNWVSNPNHALEILFPLVSVFDSVFASQLLLCMSFSGWVTSVMKWILLEDRPYWWIEETTFYDNYSRKPKFKQFPESCETGPGSPSGHSTSIAVLMMLAYMWTSHVVHDWKLRWPRWSRVVSPIVVWAIASVMLARMAVATHFPHQCLFGVMIGTFLAPALCIYVSDPYIWGYGTLGGLSPWVARKYFLFAVSLCVLISAGVYHGMKAMGVDPDVTVQLAEKWCRNREWVRITTTPLYSLVSTTAYMLAWAVCVTPAVAKYRHYTYNRSLILAAAATSMIVSLSSLVQQLASETDIKQYYAINFLVCGLKAVALLRITPAFATFYYTVGKSKTE